MQALASGPLIVYMDYSDPLGLVREHRTSTLRRVGRTNSLLLGNRLQKQSWYHGQNRLSSSEVRSLIQGEQL